MQTLSPTDTNRAAIDANDVRFQAGVHTSFQDGEDRMRRLERALEANTRYLEANTRKTDEVYEKTAEMLAVFQAMKGGFKVLEWLATVAKIVVAIGAAALFIAKLTGWTWPGSK